MKSIKYLSVCLLSVLMMISLACSINDNDQVTSSSNTTLQKVSVSGSVEDLFEASSKPRSAPAATGGRYTNLSTNEVVSFTITDGAFLIELDQGVAYLVEILIGSDVVLSRVLSQEDTNSTAITADINTVTHMLANAYKQFRGTMSITDALEMAYTTYFGATRPSAAQLNNDNTSIDDLVLSTWKEFVISFRNIIKNATTITEISSFVASGNFTDPNKFGDELDELKDIEAGPAPLSSVVSVSMAPNSTYSNILEMVKAQVDAYAKNSLATGTNFPLAKSGYDDFETISGLQSNVLISWLDPLGSDNTITGDFFGANADYIAYFGDGWNADWEGNVLGSAPQYNGSPTAAWLWVNHEYISNDQPEVGSAPNGQHLTYANFLKQQGVFDFNVRKSSEWTQARVDTYTEYHKKQIGGSWVRVLKDTNTNNWVVNTNADNKRYDATAATLTKVVGHTVSGLDQKDDGTPLPANVVVGIMGDCSGGTTPWGTVISAEENTQDYYGDVQSAWNSGGKYSHDNGLNMGGNISFTFTPSSSSAFGLHSNDNHKHRRDFYGFLAEMDPGKDSDEYYSNGEGHRKIGAFGRVRWENCAVVTNEAFRLIPNQKVVMYGANDRRGGRIYKFVSEDNYTLDMDKAQVRALLDEGTIYVAHFADLDNDTGLTVSGNTPTESTPGAGQWIELSVENTTDVAPNAAALNTLNSVFEASTTVGAALKNVNWNGLAGFPTDNDVRMAMYSAAAKIGVKGLNRPEDLEWNPIAPTASGNTTPRLFIAFTNHTSKNQLNDDGIRYASSDNATEDPWYAYTQATGNALDYDTSSENRADSLGALFALDENDTSNPANSSSFTFHSVWSGEALSATENNDFVAKNPDNILIDKEGGVWFGTDGDYSSGAASDSLYYVDLNPSHKTTTVNTYGKAFRILSVPSDAEATGPSFSSDMGSIFISVQHPGERFDSNNNPISNWPNQRDLTQNISEAFTLQILHSADADGDGDFINNVPVFSALLNKFRDQMPGSTLTLYSGDSWISGPLYQSASDSAFESLLGVEGAGRAHVAVLNAMGFQASALGNHEFDQGTDALVGIITSDSSAGNTWEGAQYPYLSTNLDFSTDEAFDGIIGTNGVPFYQLKGKVASYTKILVNGEYIGIVGATTPLLDTISSPYSDTSGNAVTVSPSDSTDYNALAALIQADVDALIAQGINKIILLSHMQQLSIEKTLAAKLSGVDIIIGGGSNSVLADNNDRLRSGHVAVDTYPIVLSDVDSNPILVLNTDGDYEYLGRLVVEFDSNGLVVVSSIDDEVSGAYATDSTALSEQNATLADHANETVVAIANAMNEFITLIEGNTFGKTAVYLNGVRESVRTEETNLGNLSADANKWYAEEMSGETVQLSLKNGGGIRAAIGQCVVPPGGTGAAICEPPAEIPGIKEAGEISQNDIQTALLFNNSIALVTVSANELKDIMEHAVSATASGATPGQFPQISGFTFTYNPNLTARVADSGGNVTTAGNRVLSIAVLNDDGSVYDRVVSDGEVIGDINRTFRMATLGFLATGGDSYPLEHLASANLVDLQNDGTQTGAATFADDGTEQDALAEYLNEFYSVTAYAVEDTSSSNDKRIVVDQGMFSSVTTLDFTSFNDQEAALEVLGFRVFGPNANLAADVEPEYITVSANSAYAWVSLQENNGLAKVDLASKTIVTIFPFGFKDYGDANNELDPSDKDGSFSLRTADNVVGIYMPDAVASYTVAGVDYVITANEGDSRDYDAFSEEERVKDVTLDGSVFDLNTVLDDDQLGRLKLTANLYSSTASDNYSSIPSFGARSFSIWNGHTGALVYDSGSDLALRANNAGKLDDGRSDDKGVEPEAVVMGNVQGSIVAFIGLERANCVISYDVTDPSNVSYLQTLYADGDEAPEGLLFIDAATSPTGNAILLVSNEVSGTVSVFEASDGSSFENVDTFTLVGGEGAAEITAYDSVNHYLFTVNNSLELGSSSIDILQLSDEGTLTAVGNIGINIYGGGVNSVAIHGGLLAAAIEADDKQDNGSVVVFDTTTFAFKGQATVGALPDMVTFTPNGLYILTANEGEPNSDYDNDPNGSISIISIGSEVPSVTANTNLMLQNTSSTNVYLNKASGFEKIEIYNLLTSEDTVAGTSSANFIYGSMADGAGLIANSDGTFTLINNIEADYAIARITFDSAFHPVSGEYILDAEASAETAQCSGTLITIAEHGFGPQYLSGGEWGGSSKGVFITDPAKDVDDKSTATLLTALGQWSTENAVPIGKDAYSDKTVVFIGDDHSDDQTPSGQLAMYVGDRGDLENGNLYALRVTTDGVSYEMDMQEGVDYKMDFVQLHETEIDALDAEAKAAGAMGFSRLEDIDWRRGSASNQREIYFAVTGRKKTALIGKGTLYGRIYKVVLNPDDPTGAGTITCVLDGDNLTGRAKDFHSPDNVLATYNYLYIQEDPNGYPDTADKSHYARLYQYNLNTGALKVVLECAQAEAAADGYGSTSNTWEITGMIDVSDILGSDETFLLITQNHGWEAPAGSYFSDQNALGSTKDVSAADSNEGSMLYLIKGLGR